MDAPSLAEPIALYRSSGGEPIKEADREELLKAVRDGEVVELEFEAVTFIQRDTPNRNYVRFPPGKLAGFAASFKGMPFLRDHATYDSTSRGGTIVDAKLEHNADGSKQMRMRVRAVKSWAVEGLLDGTIDRFSIGWDRQGMEAQCSIHLASWYSCSCRLGATLEDGRHVEILVPSPVGTEMSTILVPAVVGTTIESISQLGIDSSRLADSLVRNATLSVAEGNKNMDPKLVTLLAVLGITASSATALDDGIKAAEKLAADREEAIEQRDEAKGKLATVEIDAKTKLTAERATITKEKLTALKAAGKLRPGSGREDRLKKRAETDFADFLATCEELLADGEQVTAAGKTLAAATKDPAGATAATPAKAAVVANPQLASWLKSAGISEEQFEKHGGNGLAYVEAMNKARG